MIPSSKARSEPTANLPLQVVTAVGLLVFCANYMASTYQRGKETFARALVLDAMLKSQQLPAQARSALDGDADAFLAFDATRRALDADLHALQEGDGRYSGWQGAAVVGEPLQALSDHAKAASADAGRMIDNRDAVIALAKSADQLRSQVGPLKARMDEIAKTASEGGNAAQALPALRQYILADSLVGEANAIRRGEPDAAGMAEALARDGVRFVAESKVLLCVGGSELVQGDCDLAALGSLGKLVLDTKQSLDTIAHSARPAGEAWAAERRIAKSAPAMLEDSQDVLAALDALPVRRVFPSTYIAVLSGVLALVGLLMIQMRTIRALRRKAGVTGAD